MAKYRNYQKRYSQVSTDKQLPDIDSPAGMTIICIVLFLVVSFLGYAIIEAPKLQQRCDEVMPGSKPYSPSRTAEVYCKGVDGVLHPMR